LVFQFFLFCFVFQCFCVVVEMATPAADTATAATPGSSASASSAALKQSGKLSHILKVSASSSSLTAIQQELVCSVCLDLFNDPVCLRCGHNVCYKCAYRMVAFAKACSTLHPENVNLKAEQSRDAIEHAATEASRIASTVLMPSEEDKKETMKEKQTIEALKELAEPVDPAVEITCPLCREKTLLGDVMPNIALRNMVTDLRLRAPPSFMPEITAEKMALEKEQELLKAQLRHRPHCVFVTATGYCYKDASVYCADCGSLCEEHAKFLHKSGPQRFHKLSSTISPEVFFKTQERLSRMALSASSSLPHCAEHGNPKDLFCLKCKELVCDNCKMAGTHKEHDCIGISQASKEFDGWIEEMKKSVSELLPVCKTLSEGYEQWIKDEEKFRELASSDVHKTFGLLLKCAEEHERTVCDHAKTLYETFDENTRRRAEGVDVIIKRGQELVASVKSSERVSAFAREIMQRDLNEQLIILSSVLKNVPKDQTTLLTVEDHRKLLLDMKLVHIKRDYRLNSCGTEFPINIESLLSSTSEASDIPCGEDKSAHDGGAIIDIQRRLIVSVSGNCNNGKDVMFIDIDKKTTERVRSLIPYGTHGQYPLFDGDKRVYFFESESRNNDSFGYVDLETRKFTQLKKCPSPFREFARSCYMNGHVYAVCRDKNIWDYDVENEKWSNLEIRVGKIGLCADPFTHSLVIIKKRAKFCLQNLDTKEQTTLPLPPNTFNLGSNQEMVFIRLSADNFLVIVSLDSSSLYAFTSVNKKWSQLRWRNVRNGSAHMVFDPETSAFYYKIDSERNWYIARVKMD